MANIALKTADKVEMVESRTQLTLPADESISAGSPVRIDTVSGNFTNGNATTTTENRVFGLALKSVQKGETVTALRHGVMDGFTLTGAFDSDVYLSDTDGRIADGAGTTNVKIGRIIPACGNLLGQAKDKLLFVSINN